MKFEIMDTDWGTELQTDLADYMAELYESVDGDQDVKTVSGQPFCACDVCVYRETLSFVAPLIIEGYLTGKIRLLGVNNEI